MGGYQTQKAFDVGCVFVAGFVRNQTYLPEDPNVLLRDSNESSYPVIAVAGFVRNRTHATEDTVVLHPDSDESSYEITTGF